MRNTSWKDRKALVDAMIKDKSRKYGSQAPKTQLSRLFRCVLPFPSGSLYSCTAIPEVFHSKKVLEHVDCMMMAAELRHN